MINFTGRLRGLKRGPQENTREADNRDRKKVKRELEMKEGD